MRWPWTKSEAETEADEIRHWAATANLRDVMDHLNRTLDNSEKAVQEAVHGDQ